MPILWASAPEPARSLPLSVASLDDHDTTLRFRRRCLRRTWWRLWRSWRQAADGACLGNAVLR